MKTCLFATLVFGFLFAVPAWADEGDVIKGGQIFRSKCMMCHAPDQNKVGPKLGGVVGRKAASVVDYNYSSGLKAKGQIWDAATLDKWLTGPSALVTGTKMTFKLDNPQDRANVIAYLKTLPAK